MTAHIRELLPVDGRVIGIVVGLETYQGKRFEQVRYAAADARGFADLLADMYGDDRVEVEVLVDEDATKTHLDYQIDQAIKSASADDLFVFFYAGHGFFSDGDNYLTAFDTGKSAVIETSIPVVDGLVQPLANSRCRRALLFIDACATKVNNRALISSFDGSEVTLPDGNRDDYFAAFFSCQRGQSSYSGPALKHGVWTYHLLSALRGDAPKAIAEKNMVTDVSLRDFLRQAVPRYIRDNLNVSGRQVPEALIRASSTFAIRLLPTLPTITDASDLRIVSAPVQTVYFEGVLEASVKQLGGFNKRAHRVPWDYNATTRTWVKEIAWPDVKEDLKDVYDRAKLIFGLRREDLKRESSESDASGALHCEYFRYSIEAMQNPDDQEGYRIVRQLVIRDPNPDVVTRCQRVFSPRVNRLVIQVDNQSWDFDELVARFEDMQDAVGGDLSEDEDTSTIEYSPPDGSHLAVDVDNGRIAFSAGDNSIPQLIERARGMRFGLTGHNQLALR